MQFYFYTIYTIESTQILVREGLLETIFNWAGLLYMLKILQVDIKNNISKHLRY